MTPPDSIATPNWVIAPPFLLPPQLGVPPNRLGKQRPHKPPAFPPKIRPSPSLISGGVWGKGRGGIARIKGGYIISGNKGQA